MGSSEVPVCSEVMGAAGGKNIDLRGRGLAPVAVSRPAASAAVTHTLICHLTYHRSCRGDQLPQRHGGTLLPGPADHAAHTRLLLPESLLAEPQRSRAHLTAAKELNCKQMKWSSPP